MKSAALRPLFLFPTAAWACFLASTPGAPEEQPAASAPPPANACTLVLAKALDGGGDVTLHLRERDGAFRQAWATLPACNTACPADAAGLRRDGANFAGPVKITADRVLYELDLQAVFQDGRLAGSFQGSYGTCGTMEVKGEFGGELAARPKPDGPAGFELSLGSVVFGGNNAQRQTTLRFELHEGCARNAKFTSQGGDSAWTATLDKMDLKFDGKSLKGAVLTTLTCKCPVLPGEYTIQIDARVAGSAVTGTVGSRLGEREVKPQSFFGTVKSLPEEKPDAEDGLYTLTLEGAVEKSEPLKLFLDRRGGAFTGLCLSPRMARAPHEADFSRLKLKEGALEGEVIISVNPWGWPTGRRRPVAYSYALKGAVAGGAVKGTYEGRCLTRAARGALHGGVEELEAVRKRETLTEGHDYPNWRGPFGNGSSRPCGRELVDSLQSARLVWKSEERTPDSWLWSRNANTGVSGGYASPIVAAGRVYLFYYVPSGEQRGMLLDKQGKKICVAEPEDAPEGGKYAIGADDVMLCLEAATGRTLWITVFKGKGQNFNAGLAGPFMMPCVAEGKVYAIGSAGRVYCLDAAAGATVWESTLGAATGKAAQVLEAARKSGEMPRFNRDFCAAPAVAGGAVVCNDNEGGLIGLDAADGKLLWGPLCDCTAKANSPARWRHQDKDYVIVASHKALCLEPRTGRIVWECPEVAHEGAPAVCEDYLVLSGGARRGAGGEKKSAGLSAYRIDLKSAKLAWDLGGKYNNHVTCPVIYNRHVYGFCEEATICVELETGKIVGRAPFPGVRSCSSMVAADGRLLREHLYQQLFFFKAEPRDFRQLGPLWTPPSHAECTTSTIVDGRLFLRGKDGVYCYDLRKAVRRPPGE